MTLKLFRKLPVILKIVPKASHDHDRQGKQEQKQTTLKKQSVELVSVFKNVNRIFLFIVLFKRRSQKL
jgi:hypothetical protein